MDINLARTLANIAKRAATLFDDGYTATQWDTLTDTWTVKKPDGKTEYRVVLPIEGSKPYCTCEAYKQFDTCKHYLAVEQEHHALAELAAKHDREEAEAESSRYGVDWPEGPMTAGGCHWPC